MSQYGRGGMLVFLLLSGTVSRAADLPPIDWTPTQAERVERGGSPTPFTPRRIIGTVSFGLALVSVVMGIVFGMQALDVHRQLHASPVSDGLSYREFLVDKGETAALVTNVSWGAAGAFGIAGGLLWIF